MAPTSRMFVAVVPPPAVLEGVAAIERPDVRGVRWTRPGQWHVTLQFLGDVDEEVARQGVQNVSAAPVEAELTPRVLDLGQGAVALEVRGLEPVHAAVVSANAAVGIEAPSRRFRGHLTVARVRGGAGSGTAGGGTAVTVRPPPPARRWRVDEVVLFRSILGTGPAEHQVVERVRLEGA